MNNKIITINGVEFLTVKTTQGAKGIHVFKLPQNHRVGRFINIAELKEFLNRGKNKQKA